MKKQEGTVMEKEKDVWSFKTSDLVTIPNIITYVRFVLIIPFVYFFLAEQYIYAAICIGLSGLSDCFDGMAARKLNQVTPLGKILDPIADKVTLFAVVICMVIYVPMVLPILVTLLVKDLIMLLVGADLIKKRLTPPSANWYGKVGTIIFYFSVCLIVFLKAFFAYENIKCNAGIWRNRAAAGGIRPGYCPGTALAGRTECGWTLRHQHRNRSAAVSAGTGAEN